MKVICELANVYCTQRTCPHKYPHEPISINDTENGNPQCGDDYTFCYIKQRNVNCKSVQGVLVKPAEIFIKDKTR